MRTALTFLTAILFITSCSKEIPPPSVSIQPAKVMTVGEQYRLTREIPGRVRAAQRSDLAFQVSGQIVEFDMKEGQEVKEGTILARLDDSDYKSAADAATAERNKNKANFDRAEELIVGKFISQSDYDRIKATYDVSVANLERSEKALNDSRLIAPFSGVVARTFVENFEDVQAKQPILSLQNPDDLEIVIALSETIVARRKDTATIEVFASFDALPEQTFELYIKEFAAEADPLTQTFEVVAGITEKNLTNILPGMTATVNVTRTDVDDGAGPLVVPLAAIVAGEGDTPSVWKVGTDNKVRQQVVVTGQLAGSDQVEISSGLVTGDIIVTAGVSSLSDGKEIAPITEVKF